MNLQALKRWHWAVIGLVAGIAIAFTHQLVALDQRIGGDGFIDQAEFERALGVLAYTDKTYITDIVIHPRPDVDLIRLRRLVAGKYEWCMFAAPRPYKPLGAEKAPNPNYCAKDFVLEIAPKAPIAAAWQHAPQTMFAIYAAVGFLIGGSIWPAVLRLMIRSGWGHKPDEPLVDLRQFENETPPQTRIEITDEDLQRLKQLEAEMEAALIGSDQPAKSLTSSSPTAPVKELSTSPVEHLPAQTDIDKDYAGEFYPVEKKTQRGFTLIEMIVVLGMCSLLLSILLPVLVIAQRRAEQIKCASNLHQIGAALMSYANANQGWLPAWSGWHTWPTGTSDDSPGPAWTIELMPYIGTPDSAVYNCPSFPAKDRRRNYFLAAQWTGHLNKHAMKLTDITMSSRFVLSGDKTQRGLYPPPFGSSEHQLDDADPDDFGSDLAVLAWPWEKGGFYMHRGGNNVLFDDMHVALFSNYDSDAVTFNPHRMEDWADVSSD